MSNLSKYLEELTDEAKQYADLRIDELKLRATKGLSTALSQLLSMLLIFSVLLIVLGLLAYALLQWINLLIGAPWGTFTVCGVFAIVLAVLVALRRKLFKGRFIQLFIDAFFDHE